MTKGNVELVRSAIDAWNAGDMNKVSSLYHPDAISTAPKDWPEPGPFVGRNAIMRQFQGFRQAWSEDSIEISGELRGLDDLVLVPMVMHGIGHGPAASFEFTLVYTVGHGLITGLKVIWGHDEGAEPVAPDPPGQP